MSLPIFPQRQPRRPDEADDPGLPDLGQEPTQPEPTDDTGVASGGDFGDVEGSVDPGVDVGAVTADPAPDADGSAVNEPV